jgi:putative Ca2+/H+ antiporter (TMEM165/GDT1 family)
VLAAFAVATVLITLAELGDKTQLLALVLACRYKAWQVLVGIFVATLVVHLLSTIVGQTVGDLVPQRVLAVATGLLFIGFGVWTLRGDSVDEGEEPKSARFGPILTTAIAFFVAELGDKTQIMTMTVAADPSAALRTFGSFAQGLIPSGAAMGTATERFVGVWMGSTLGMMIADGIAIVAGSVLGKRLPERLITRVSGGIFILFGVAAIAVEFLG